MPSSGTRSSRRIRPTLVAGDVRDDQHADSSPWSPSGRRDAVHPCGLRRDVPRELDRSPRRSRRARATAAASVRAPWRRRGSRRPTPPIAGARFSTRATYGTLVFSTRTCPARDVAAPATAAAVRRISSVRARAAAPRRSAQRAVGQPHRRAELHLAGDVVDPVVQVVRVRTRRSWRTSVQICDALGRLHLERARARRTAGPGGAAAGTAAPGVPSEVPSVSRWITSACAIGTVPPIVNAVIACTRGGAVYVGWSGQALDAAGSAASRPAPGR